MAKKKTNGLSVAIIALNIVIVGIVILLVVLVYLHMKEDTDNGRPQSTTTTVSESTTVSETAASVTSESAAEEVTTTMEEETADESTASTVQFYNSYNRGYFDNDLFIGDSISTGLYLYGFLDKSNVFAEVGLNPESAVSHQIDGVTSVEKTSAMQPRNIYIMLGTNGLAYFDGSYMANKMVELVAELEVACPTASIYIITIPPVTAAHEAEGSETMELVNGYNSQLKNLCAIGGYGCIDLCALLQDENGYLSSRYAEEDGLHFLGDAYTAMLGYIEQCTG